MSLLIVLTRFHHTSVFSLRQNDRPPLPYLILFCFPSSESAHFGMRSLASACACPDMQAARTGSHDSQVGALFMVVSFFSPSSSPRLSCFFFSLFFFMFLLLERLRRGNVTQYLMLRSPAASDSFARFWSAARLMRLPVCTAC